MIKCNKCKKTLIDEWKFCPYCGENVKVIENEKLLQKTILSIDKMLNDKDTKSKTEKFQKIINFDNQFHKIVEKKKFQKVIDSGIIFKFVDSFKGEINDESINIIIAKVVKKFGSFENELIKNEINKQYEEYKEFQNFTKSDFPVDRIPTLVPNDDLSKNLKIQKTEYDIKMIKEPCDKLMEIKISSRNGKIDSYELKTFVINSFSLSYEEKRALLLKVDSLSLKKIKELREVFYEEKYSFFKLYRKYNVLSEKNKK